MKDIISPIDKDLIKAELTADKLLRKTNKANNELYVFTAHEAPNTMQEIGRLREIAFRAGGGGTGLDRDIDECDTMPNPYKQMIVWNPEAEEIIGGYRFFLGKDCLFDEKGQPILSTAHMFEFSNNFIKNYLPQTIELGRSFVRLEYQSTRAGSRGLFALDNLWDGLGALATVYPETKHFFGKVTMYPTQETKWRDLILFFLEQFFGDKDGLVKPFHPLTRNTSNEELFATIGGKDYKEDYKALNTSVRELGYNIPPLVNAYMGLSSSMKVFGTAINDEFGDVEETGILISVDEIEPEKKKRFIETFEKSESGLFQKLHA
jgi:hypothetical protein